MSTCARKTAANLDLDVANRRALTGTSGVPRILTRCSFVIEPGTFRLSPHPEWSGDFTDWTADPFTDRNWRLQPHPLRALSKNLGTPHPSHFGV